VVLVTGGSRGIGEAIARLFVARGARVAISARKLQGLAGVAESIAAAHGKDAVFAVGAHSGQEDQCVRLVREVVGHFGRIDVLVNNAATSPHYGPLLGADGAAWDKTFDVNLKGYFWCAREVARHLVDRRAPGSIIHVASILGIAPAPMQGVYSMTKAAVLSMTKTLAMELGPSRVRVNAIAPGFTETTFIGSRLKDELWAADIQKRTPLGRFGTPEDVAEAAAYLASDAASFVTGHALVVDGGFSHPG
jgi:NAD(P)-dependent dehydrogenase (short-subunit alcohol dehydrogenase family)